ncbi:unnamed protein product [Rhizoctonia solani]|uniref:Uncharacterized protein n=1 Tax=Rhizoctonia solani TaxID=456999 RepID=A0A8H3E3P7_9AGAM|nr:unnamed protein product [Rhizoctonia solani]
MINLICQGYIRRKFAGNQAPELPTISTSQTPGTTNNPVPVLTMTRFAEEAQRHDTFSNLAAPATNRSDVFTSETEEEDSGDINTKPPDFAYETQGV